MGRTHEELGDIFRRFGLSDETAADSWEEMARDGPALEAAGVPEGTRALLQEWASGTWCEVDGAEGRALTSRGTVPGSSMSPFQVGMFALAKSVFTRLYNAFQEAVFFAFPKGRTQPLAEHKLAKSGNDLNGRDKKQQDTLVAHDRLTLITDSVLNIIL